MNRLSKYLLIGLLEQESKIVALYGGGFKPPTKGHFEVVKKTLEDHPKIPLEFEKLRRFFYFGYLVLENLV
jgi:hypothetical protein